MMQRRNISSGAPWEAIVGYSRAVLVGSNIYISGTTAIDENGNIVGENNTYEQTKQIIKNIEMVLRKINASLSDVVRTRIFVTDIQDWKKSEKPIKKLLEILCQLQQWWKSRGLSTRVPSGDGGRRSRDVTPCCFQCLIIETFTS